MSPTLIASNFELAGDGSTGNTRSELEDVPGVWPTGVLLKVALFQVLGPAAVDEAVDAPTAEEGDHAYGKRACRRRDS